MKLSILGNRKKIPAVILTVLCYTGKCAILETQSCNQATPKEYAHCLYSQE